MSKAFSEMNKMFSEIDQDAQEQAKKLKQQSTKTSQTDVAQSVSDVETSDGDIGKRSKSAEIQIDKLQTIISELSAIKVAPPTTVRLAEAEKQDIEDFMHGTLRKRSLQGQSVSIAKLMRYALRYMMKVHSKEFVDALEKALKKEEKLSI